MNYHQYTFQVEPTSIDANGHVNNVEYVRWMQDVATAHASALGTMDLMAIDGATWVVREHRIKYLQAAFEGETIGVQTWVANFRRVRSTRRYRFVRLPDLTVLAEGETEWIYVDVETAKPRSAPKNLQDIFNAVVSDGPPVSNW